MKKEMTWNTSSFLVVGVGIAALQVLVLLSSSFVVFVFSVLANQIALVP